MAIFACSFDAASPLAPWTSAANVSIVAGRDANGCFIPSGGSAGTLTLVAGMGASLDVGLAFKPNSFANSIFTISDDSGFTGAGFVRVDNVGDGRMYLTVGAALLSSVQVLMDGFVQPKGLFCFYDVVASIVQVVTPVDATHSNVQVSVAADLYVNNSLIGSAGNTWNLLNILNVNIPAGSFGRFVITHNDSIVDDVYVNGTRIGDAFVAPDDTTVTVETAAPDLTQTVIEVGLIDPTAAPDVTQSPIEVGLAPLLTIACPVGPLTATVGVLFTSDPPIVSSDTPPDTFVLLSGPAWMSINATTGVVSGIPDVSGPVTYTIQVTDSVGNVATTAPGCTLAVLGITCPIGSGTGTVGVLFTSNPPAVVGGTEPFIFVLLSGPAWLSINSTTGAVSGIPTANGTFTYVIQITDSLGNVATTEPGCSVTIRCPATFLPGSGGSGHAPSAGDHTGTIVLPKFQPGKGGNRFGND